MLNHKGTLTMTTDRLTLRQFSMDDVPAMYKNWATDEKVLKYVSWKMHANAEETRELLEKWTAQYTEEKDRYNWAIVYMNEAIGGINLHNVSNKNLSAEMGYNIGSKWWNMGLMTEAVGAVLDFAFREVGFNKICAMYDTENIGSGRVMQKNGMVEEGLFKMHTRRKDGTWGDMAFYSKWNARC